MKNTNFKNNIGFTLIELIIVVAVIAILVAVALPNYRDYVIKANRADGIAAIQRIQLLQEKYRMNNIEYTNSLVALSTSNKSELGKYNLAITGSNGIGYTITATPNEADAKCGSLSLQKDGNTLNYISGNNDVCWKK